MNRILLVEDHERLADLISKQLIAAGIAVDVFDRIDTALAAAKQVPYQALVLDRGLPDGDGLDLLQSLRSAGVGMPCLVLTARDALHDRIQGLDRGADDYLTKPFAMDELLARVRALLRRPVESVVLDPTHGDLQIKPSVSMLCCGDETIALHRQSCKSCCCSFVNKAMLFAILHSSRRVGGLMKRSHPMRWMWQYTGYAKN